jgi:hypothetical protein
MTYRISVGEVGVNEYNEIDAVELIGKTSYSDYVIDYNSELLQNKPIIPKIQEVRKSYSDELNLVMAGATAYNITGLDVAITICYSLHGLKSRLRYRLWLMNLYDTKP